MQRVSRRATLGDVNTRLRRLVAAVAVTGASVLAAACGDDAAPTADSSAAITTAPSATEAPPSTEAPSTTEPAPETTAAETTTPVTEAPTTTAAPAGWTSVGPMPSLAYLPCCASNYVGDPSPAIPADPAAALEPGIYRAFRQQPADGEPVETDTITFSLAPYVACGTPDVFCEEGFVDGEVGVGDVARQVTLPLDTDLRVVVGGFACEADDSNYVTDHQAATGVELATLQAELDAAYAEVVVPLVEADTPFEDYASIFAEPVGGFSVPCLFAGQLQFQGSAGPAILLQSLTVYDEADGVGVVPASISIAVIHMTALEVTADGSQTLYFYAGFLS